MMMMMTDNIPTDILYTILLNGGFELLMVNRQLNNFKNDKNVIEKINELMYTDDERRIKYIEDTIINFIGRTCYYNRRYLWAHFNGIGLCFTQTIEYIKDDLFWTCMRVQQKWFDKKREKLIDDEYQEQARIIRLMYSVFHESEEYTNRSLEMLKHRLNEKRMYFSEGWGFFKLGELEDLVDYYNDGTITGNHSIWFKLLIRTENKC